MPIIYSCVSCTIITANHKDELSQTHLSSVPKRRASLCGWGWRHSASPQLTVKSPQIPPNDRSRSLWRCCEEVSCVPVEENSTPEVIRAIPCKTPVQGISSETGGVGGLGVEVQQSNPNLGILAASLTIWHSSKKSDELNFIRSYTSMYLQKSMTK